MVGTYRGDLKLFWRLLQHARGSYHLLAGILVLNLLGPVLALLYPLPLKIAVDSVLGSHPLPWFLVPVVPAGATASKVGILILAVVLLLAIAGLTQLQLMASALLANYSGERLQLNFRSSIFWHVQRLSVSLHESRGTADASYRILRDASSINDILVDGVIPLFSAGVMFVGLLYLTARFDLQLALVAISISPVLLFCSWFFRRRLRKQSRNVKQVEAEVMSTTQEVLGTLRVVKAFGSEKREQQRFVRHSTEGFRSRIRLTLLGRQLSLSIGLVMAAGQAAILFLGIGHVRAGVLTLGELLMVMSYVRRLYDPLRTGTQKSANLQSALASAERVFVLLDEEPDVVDRIDARPLTRAEGHISFRNVYFAYDKVNPVLHDISFDIPARSRTYISGPSGAGKTTLMNLLTRFYDPTSGEIVLDGVDLRDLKVSDLRNQFAIVLQEPVLFSSTVAENIAYARPEAGVQEIIDAAMAANAHEFITRLPDGYNTRLGERGMRLSGGERQRIAIARAFLKNAPILILDEATSSVDLRSEAAIMEAMERLMANRTTFIIAHRPGTLGNCSLTVQIENGRLCSLTSAPERPLVAMGS